MVDRYKELEDRVTQLELRINEKITDTREEVHLSKIEKDRENIKLVAKAIEYVSGLPIKVIFFKQRKGISKVPFRRILYYILKEEYKITELIIQMELLKMYEFKVDRATIYYHIDLFKSNMLTMVDTGYKVELDYYHAIKEWLNRKK